MQTSVHRSELQADIDNFRNSDGVQIRSKYSPGNQDQEFESERVVQHQQINIYLNPYFQMYPYSSILLALSYVGIQLIVGIIALSDQAETDRHG